MFKFLFILVWIICSILSYGIGFAYLQGKFKATAEEDYIENIISNATFSMIGGPISLLVNILCSEKFKYGLKFW